jgi:hypothetical protein
MDPHTFIKRDNIPISTDGIANYAFRSVAYHNQYFLVDLFLIKNDVNPNTIDGYPLHICCEKGHIETLTKLLLDDRLCIHKSHLKIAWDNYQTHIVKLLLCNPKLLQELSQQDIDHYSKPKEKAQFRNSYKHNHLSVYSKWKRNRLLNKNKSGFYDDIADQNDDVKLLAWRDNDEISTPYFADSDEERLSSFDDDKIFNSSSKDNDASDCGVTLPKSYKNYSNPAYFDDDTSERGFHKKQPNEEAFNEAAFNEDSFDHAFIKHYSTQTPPHKNKTHKDFLPEDSFNFSNKHHTFADENDPFEDESDSFDDENDPFADESDAFDDENDPFADESDAFDDENDPFADESDENDPFADESDAFDDENDPFADENDLNTEFFTQDSFKFSHENDLNTKFFTQDSFKFSHQNNPNKEF